jgi:hypothetical protein
MATSEASQKMDAIIRSRSPVAAEAAAIDQQELQEMSLDLQAGLVDFLEIVEDIADTVDTLPPSPEKDQIEARLEDAVDTFWHDVVKPYDEIETLAGIDDTTLEDDPSEVGARVPEE